jgi:hypothetical protein
MADLVKRLKARRMSWVGAGMDHDPDCTQAAARIEALTEAFTDLQRGQTYRYIGRDGKTVLARDLEDRIEALTADLAAAKTRAAPLFSDDDDRIEHLVATNEALTTQLCEVLNREAETTARYDAKIEALTAERDAAIARAAPMFADDADRIESLTAATARAEAAEAALRNIDENLAYFLSRKPQKMMLPETVAFIRDMARKPLAKHGEQP